MSALAVLCLVSVLALSSCVSAEERAILPGDSFAVEVDLDLFEVFTYSWSCDVQLDFTVTDPLGNDMPYDVGATSGSGTIPSWTSGTYTLTWDNDGSSIAHLSFDLSDTFSEVENAMSALLWGLIIAAIVIVAVIVIVVIVVVMGGKKTAPPQQMGAPPPMAPQALATGHCPTCGNQIDVNASFCAKCGTRYR
jgi:hypothetical protein